MHAPRIRGIEVTELFDSPASHGFDVEPQRTNRRYIGRLAAARAGSPSTQCSAKRISNSPPKARNSSRVVEIVSLAGRSASGSALVDIDVRVLLCRTSPSHCGRGRSGVSRVVYMASSEKACSNGGK